MFTVTDGTDEVSENVNVIVTGAVVIEAANLLTGSIAEPMFAYYDLEAVSVIELTEA